MNTGIPTDKDAADTVAAVKGLREGETDQQQDERKAAEEAEGVYISRPNPLVGKRLIVLAMRIGDTPEADERVRQFFHNASVPTYAQPATLHSGSWLVARNGQATLLSDETFRERFEPDPAGWPLKAGAAAPISFSADNNPADWSQPTKAEANADLVRGAVQTAAKVVIAGTHGVVLPSPEWSQARAGEDAAKSPPDDMGHVTGSPLDNLEDLTDFAFAKLVARVPQGGLIPAWHGMFRWHPGDGSLSTAFLPLALVLRLVWRVVVWCKSGSKAPMDPHEAYQAGYDDGYAEGREEGMAEAEDAEV